GGGAWCYVALTHGGHSRARDRCGIGCLLAPEWRKLQLEVEAYGVVAGFGGKREKIGEPWDAGAVHRLLPGKPAGVLRARLDPADVVAQHLGVGKLEDCRSRSVQPFSVGGAGDVGIEQRIVTDDDDAIARDRAVELERRDADAQRGRETR